MQIDHDKQGNPRAVLVRNQILQGDVLDQLKKLADKSVNCIGTSPPYYGLRDYGLPPTDWPEVSYAPLAGLPPITIPAMTCCLGLEDNIEAYIGHMVSVWRELRRVLRDDGTCWLNLGDSYFGSWGNYGDAGGGQRAKATERLDRRFYEDKKDWRPPTSYSQQGLKPKDLMGIPWRVALALQADGWYLRSDIIWAKKNPMPESVTDRPTKAHEYVFLLTKSERYWYDQDAIREVATSTDRPQPVPEMKSIKPNNTDWLDNRYAPGASGYGVSPAGRNKRTVWSIATKPYKEAHFAVFPEALAEFWILAGCPARVCVECGEPWMRAVEKVKGDNPENFNGSTFTNGKTSVAANALSSVGQKPRTVARKTVDYAQTCACNAAHRPGIILDPFFGSGTVAVVAEKLKRDWLGIELNPAYIELARRRIERTQPALFAR